MILAYTISLTLLALIAALSILRVKDGRDDRAEWSRLAALQPASPGRFTPDMVADLPEPARRFFTFAIQPGTPLFRVAEIDMDGQFALGPKDRPGYRPIEADQILAAPEGLVWAMRTRGGLPISGSDTGTWTRFRILGLVPVARAGGTKDHRRSAFGRCVAEAVFWTPAALLPGPGITWDAVDGETARVTVRHGGLTQAIDVTVDDDGQPLKVAFDRWSNANAEKTHRLQPFGGFLADFRDVGGFRLPHKVEAGNMFGTDAYFPFFLVRVTEIRFPGAPGHALTT